MDERAPVHSSKCTTTDDVRTLLASVRVPVGALVVVRGMVVGQKVGVAMSRDSIVAEQFAFIAWRNDGESVQVEHADEFSGLEAGGYTNHHKSFGVEYSGGEFNEDCAAVVVVGLPDTEIKWRAMIESVMA